MKHANSETQGCRAAAAARKLWVSTKRSLIIRTDAKRVSFVNMLTHTRSGGEGGTEWGLFCGELQLEWYNCCAVSQRL